MGDEIEASDSAEEVELRSDEGVLEAKKMNFFRGVLMISQEGRYSGMDKAVLVGTVSARAFQQCVAHARRMPLRMRTHMSTHLSVHVRQGGRAGRHGALTSVD